ncbi:unnamed protein product, partial [Didymodactylos carnosus]
EREGWRFIALVIDRFFLIVFVVLTVTGSFATLLSAPAIHNKVEPIEKRFSQHHNPSQNN